MIGSKTINKQKNQHSLYAKSPPSEPSSDRDCGREQQSKLFKIVMPALLRSTRFLPKFCKRKPDGISLGPSFGFKFVKPTTRTLQTNVSGAYATSLTGSTETLFRRGSFRWAAAILAGVSSAALNC